MLKKLPLDNETLFSLQYLNPNKREEDEAVNHISKIVQIFKHLLSFREEADIKEVVGQFLVSEKDPVY